MEDERDDALEEIDKLKDETVSLKEEIDQLKEELKSYEVKSVPPSAPSHLNQGRGRLHLIGPKDVF